MGLFHVGPRGFGVKLLDGSLDGRVMLWAPHFGEEDALSESILDTVFPAFFFVAAYDFAGYELLIFGDGALFEGNKTVELGFAGYLAKLALHRRVGIVLVDNVVLPQPQVF